MKEKVSVINYGVGNVYSIVNALLSLNYDCKVVVEPKDIISSDRLILPGVGAFGPAMSKLKADGLDQAIYEFVKTGKPMLGICLGFQLLFIDSEENGFFQGLGLLQGHVKSFERKSSYPIPQIQWNSVQSSESSKLFTGLQDNLFYFLHSYYAKETQGLGYKVGKTSYTDKKYTSAIECENIFGVQFHPEKSGETGLKLLDNFMRQ